MGKKSRRKREKREALGLIHNSAARKAAVRVIGQDFQSRREKLVEHFSRFNPADVAKALNGSDLWLPNISSQIQHIFAFNIFASMSAAQFRSETRLDTYSQFEDFLRTSHALFPSFAMLEDYVPEADWGDVKASSASLGYAKVFYGCTVERIVDFVDSFRLLFDDDLVALRDMNLAISLQTRLINAIDETGFGDVTTISPGHTEIPPESFWNQICNALDSIARDSADFEGLSPQLIADLGEQAGIEEWESFGEAAMSGMAVPTVFVRVDGQLFPTSLRNALSSVIEHWERSKPSGHRRPLKIDTRLSQFVALRFSEESFVRGPLQVVSRQKSASRVFFGLLKSNRHFTLIAQVEPKDLSSVQSQCKEVMKIVSQDVDWGFRRLGSHEVFQFKRSDGSTPRPTEIQILLVIVYASANPQFFDTSDLDARVLALPDFVTIFDSLSNADALSKFWAYVDSNRGSFAPIGMCDLFASFRDSNALLIDGADTFNLVSLDPHWNSTWRFQGLKDFWKRAPPLFPDGERTWVLDTSTEAPLRLVSKKTSKLAWFSKIRSCSFFVVFDMSLQELDSHNGTLLELLVNCLADSIFTRKSFFEDIDLFTRQGIVLTIRASEDALASIQPSETPLVNSEDGLFRNWSLDDADTSTLVRASVSARLSVAQERLQDPIDSSFEVDIAIECLSGLSGLVEQTFPNDLALLVHPTRTRRPRFTMKRVTRDIDVPDFALPSLPEPGDYKLARRELALVLKEQGASAPGEYELGEAKKIIDPARDLYRSRLHKSIDEFDHDALVSFCIEQNDRLVWKYVRETKRLRHSLNHEVAYDRSASLAEEHSDFVRHSRNFRYLLEYVVSAERSKGGLADTEVLLKLVASIDWLFVLYDASDSLHNDIDVAGIRLSGSFVPEVFYSENRKDLEADFSREMASFKLGIGLRDEDAVESRVAKHGEIELLDSAFATDAGFSLRNLLSVLHGLSRWPSINGSSELRFKYSAKQSTLVDQLSKSIPDAPRIEIQRIVEFLTLDPKGIRRISGKLIDEVDVPIWEHTKRAQRYTIRPLVRLKEDVLAWGAASANRALSIWSGGVADGYLPTDLPWPKVRTEVRTIKSALEKQLEVQAYRICADLTPFALHGANFRARFPNESFPDVGDFDVLAYWPERNAWILGECKYNQPPFCLKDARRLRETIFGEEKNHGQFERIERRRAFFHATIEQIRVLLGWPNPAASREPDIREIYISRQIYWWMRHPPYSVPTHFVRIDALREWLQIHVLKQETASQ